MRTRLAMSLLLACCLLTGCRREVALYPVNGRVVYRDGTPVPGGSLELVSMDAQPPRVAHGVIQSDGAFKLETVLTGGTAPGAAAGSHRALVRSPMRSERDLNKWKPTVPLRYGSYESSGLVLTVQPGSNDLTVEVDRP